jgi:hypothetical protein
MERAPKKATQRDFAQHTQFNGCFSVHSFQFSVDVCPAEAARALVSFSAVLRMATSGS